MRAALSVLASAAMLVASGCQCVRVPSELCYAGEPCATDGGDDGGAGDGGPLDAGSDAGKPDAGLDAGPADSGIDAGTDAGGDAGDPSLTNQFPALGICDTWGCVQASLPATRLTTPPGFSLERIPFSGVSSLCKQQFRGGVLLPDGRVLAVPYCANRFLVIDPVARTAAPVGPVLPFQNDVLMVPRGAFAGGVLGCDGSAWVVAEGQTQFVRVRPDSDGGFQFTFDTSLPATVPNPLRAMGAVVGKECASGFELWTTGKERRIVLEPFVPALSLASPPTDALPFFRSNGLVRDTRVVFFTGPSDTGNAVWQWVDISFVHDYFKVFSTDAGPFQGGAVGADGTKYFVDPSTGDTWVVVTTVNLGDYDISVRPGPRNAQTGFKWPAFRGDGFIYALGQSLLAIADVPDGGVFQLLGPELADAGVDPFGGLVATPAGLVAIPSEFPDVLLLMPDAGQSAPLSVLLSPFFNKL